MSLQMLSHVVLMKAGCYLDIGNRRLECFQMDLEVWLWHTAIIAVITPILLWQMV